MKNIKPWSFLLIVSVLLSLPTSIYAYGSSNLGSILNPLQVQIVTDPLDQVRNDLRQQQQQIQQDVRQYSIDQHQQLLQSQLLYQQTLQNKVICSTVGATLKNGVCVSNSQICQEYFGINTKWLGTLDSVGRPNCGCNSGYQLNEKKTQCIVSLAGNLDQGCKKISGINSYYSNETDIKKGGGMGGCSCKAGYKFAQENYYGECVSIDTVITPPVSQPISGGGSVPIIPKKEVKNITPLTQDIPSINNVIPQTKKDPNISTSDIKQVDKKGVLIKSTALRSCPSVTCDIIRYYAETSDLNITEEYKNGDWYKIKTENNTGWINGNSFDKNSIVEASLPNLNPATSSVSKSETQAPNNFWQVLKGWLGL